jgi:hypothetical protein
MKITADKRFGQQLDRKKSTGQTASLGKIMMQGGDYTHGLGASLADLMAQGPAKMTVQPLSMPLRRPMHQ